MGKAKKKKILRIVALVCVAAVVIALALLPLTADSTSDDPQASILSAEAAQTEIGETVHGGGTLAEEDAVEITVPDGVLLTEFLVENGDTVAEGDSVASVDRVSVMDTITQVQQTISYLDEQIEDARSEEVSDKITALAGGRVKAVYASAGDSVQDVMLEYGALAVLSLDSLMAVKLETTESVSTGDQVTLTFSDGTVESGLVESNVGGEVVVTVEDAGYAVGETVEVSCESASLGSGELYIHSAWAATGYSGTISSVNVSEETTISAGTTLFKLTDTEYLAEFTSLTAEREQYADMLFELFQMYQSGVITAPSAGIVSGVDSDSAYLLSSSETGWYLSLLSNAPTGDSDAQYTNYLALVTAVDDSEWNLRLNPQSVIVEDYSDLSALDLNTDAMTEQTVYSGSAPVYEWTDGQWRQVDRSEIAAGDILLFAGDSDGNFVWIIRVSASDAGEEPTEPSEPSTEPTEPSVEPTDPSEGNDGDETIQLPSGTDSFGTTGGSTQEETFEKFSLTENTILCVTPQDYVTLSITVDEADIGKLSLGQSATVRLDALQDETFTAVITEVGTSGSSNGGSGKFTVSLTLDRTENMLAGMNATATIPVGETYTALCVPVAALYDENGKTYVYTEYDAESGEPATPVEVETGLSDGENVEILSGLETGQMCYYAYYDTLELSTEVESEGFRFDFAS